MPQPCQNNSEDEVFRLLSRRPYEEVLVVMNKLVMRKGYTQYEDKSAEIETLLKTYGWTFTEYLAESLGRMANQLSKLQLTVTPK